MSYDLFFFKKKESFVTEQQIKNYLTENVAKPNEHGNQWWFENWRTGVYFCFETTDKTESKTGQAQFESFNDFENTGFLFNINFNRPDFFGLEAFLFVNEIIEALDIYVLNPQAGNSSHLPYKPDKNTLYENWSSLNHSFTKESFQNGDCYYPLSKSNSIWKHNYNTAQFQAINDEVYYAPKIFLYEKLADKKICTVTSWTKHIPNIFSEVDYIVLIREKKRVFKTVEEIGFISYKTFIKVFGNFIEDYSSPGYKIIHPDKANEVSSLFNSIKFEYNEGDFSKRLAWDCVYNVEPDLEQV